MNKIILNDFIEAGMLSVAQEVELYLVSFYKDVAFKGLAKDIPEGYKNFNVDGLVAEGNVLKIRIVINV